MIHFYCTYKETDERFRDSFSSIHEWINYKATMQHFIDKVPYQRAKNDEDVTVVFNQKVFKLKEPTTKR